MTIRRTIDDLLHNEAERESFRAAPDSYLAEHGLGAIPGDLIGTAFVHYSDRAPIEAGDAVAGIATRFSPVPFEESDLTTALEDSDDPFATLTGIGEVDTDEFIDPGGSTTTTEDTESDDGAADIPEVPAAVETDLGPFGSGQTAAPDLDDDPFFDDVTADERPPGPTVTLETVALDTDLVPEDLVSDDDTFAGGLIEGDVEDRDFADDSDLATTVSFTDIDPADLDEL